MPLTDWQFWVVTLAALWAGKVIVRQIYPARGGDDGAACGSCATGAAACAKPTDGAEGSELPVISARN